MDTSGDDPQEIAGRTVTRLVTQEGANALIGAYDPEITESASQRSERFQVPFINADTPATFLTEAGRDWFFRLGPSWRSAGEAFFSLLTQGGASAGRIVVLHTSDRAGQSVLTTVRQLASQGGYPEVKEVSFAPDATNLLGTVDQVRALQPDTIFLSASPVTVQPLIEAFGARQYKAKAVMSFGIGHLTDERYRASAPVVSGLSRSVTWSRDAANRNQAARAISGLYQRRYNTEMTEAAASAFTAVLTTAQAVDIAGATDPQALRTALLSLNVPGDQTVMPWSGIQFDETHQNVLAQTVVEQFVNGAFRIVYPSDASDQKLVWPANGGAPAP
jgi:branched-chain amino acid transport system substrate-binding protein